MLVRRKFSKKISAGYIVVKEIGCWQSKKAIKGTMHVDLIYHFTRRPRWNIPTFILSVNPQRETGL